MRRIPKGAYNPSDVRRMNALARLVDEQGVAHTARMFARVLQSSPDPMAPTVAAHLLTGIERAEAKETTR